MNLKVRAEKSSVGIATENVSLRRVYTCLQIRILPVQVIIFVESVFLDFVKC